MNRRPAGAFVGGVFFASLQFCYFVQLESQLSSAWTTYAAVGLSWMAGILAGLLFGTGGRRQEAILRWGSLASYMLAWSMLRLHPFDNRFLALYAVCVLASGAHAGCFFRSGASFPATPRSFLLHENNGFLVGMVLSLLGFSWNAGVFTFAAPVALTFLLQSF
ncbi:MAG: hypothetical protein COV48_16850 [Elusimicrobia bacterium CG11_big_fil_rev_8_21_14_0_20_64_6]|nr:MAG: hypothetical protein COV48_16850 [Elusimicrobia bacterium CG11_big_fil_rev_8_21_14_0_20_64_6]